MNLLQETIEAIRESGHTETDIVFIGSEESGHQCSWSEFCRLADFDYDNGFGRQIVAPDLIFVFADGGRLLRVEYDGAEWWGYLSPFKQPAESLHIKSLTGRTLAQADEDE